MPTIRRPGSAPAASNAPAPGEPAPGVPAEHSLTALHVPEDTTPTWELEMLVSGAVLFGLIQLPQVINGAFEGLPQRLEFSGRMTALPAYVFASTIVYVLIGAFVVHLASRTYWVALVGLDSVFPSGIQWEKIRNGPITNDVFKSRVARLPDLISRVDNFCSVIFGFGFLVAAVAFFGLLMLAVATTIGYAISGVFLHGRSPRWIIQLVFFAFVLLTGGLSIVDRRYGARLDPHSLLARAIRLHALAQYRFLGMGVYGPVMGTLLSNVRRRFVTVGMMLAVLASSFLVFVQRQVAKGDMSVDAYTYAPPGAREQTVDAVRYADQRAGSQVYNAVGFIQSDMIRDPYVRLFIPYVPANDNPVLARCPGAAPSVGASADSRAAAAIRCLAALHAVAVDGVVRPELDFRFYTDPQSGFKGIVTYIPVAGLPKGRNTISYKASPDPPEDRGRTPPPDVLIPFWL